MTAPVVGIISMQRTPTLLYVHYSLIGDVEPGLHFYVVFEDANGLLYVFREAIRLAAAERDLRLTVRVPFDGDCTFRFVLASPEVSRQIRALLSDSNGFQWIGTQLPEGAFVIRHLTLPMARRNPR